VDKVVYRRENSSIQAKVVHDELANTRSRPARPVPALTNIDIVTSIEKSKREVINNYIICFLLLILYLLAFSQLKFLQHVLLIQRLTAFFKVESKHMCIAI
jgi:hypothetical protein